MSDHDDPIQERLHLYHAFKGGSERRDAPREGLLSGFKQSLLRGSMVDTGVGAALLLLAGCSTASTAYESRPFFLNEEQVATHGRKAWYDHIVEVDPGGAEFTVA